MDAERGEIGDRPRERVARSSQEAGAAGRAAARRTRARPRRAPAPRRSAAWPTRPDLLRRPGGHDLDVDVPGGTGLELDPVAGLAQLDVALPREDHLRLRAWPWSSSSTNWFSTSSKCGPRPAEGAARARVAEREVVVLDREDVRVVGELERELECDGLHGVVVQDQPVLHALADEAVPGDRDGVLRQVTWRPGSAGRTPRSSTRPCPRRASSGRSPLTVSESSERKRVSCANSPLVAQLKSPFASQMQKFEPRGS